MLKVLFVCVHNSARSQMAEELLRNKLGNRISVQSAGLEPGSINPFVVKVLAERGIDISGKQTQNVFDFVRQSVRFHYVITVCDEANGERCPIFPGLTKRLHWSFPDPSSYVGTDDEKLEYTRLILNLIEIKINAFIEELTPIISTQ